MTIKYDPAETEEEQVYYTIHTRHGKFENGESLDDLARRADQAIDTTIWPHVVEALRPRKVSEMKDTDSHPEEAHIVLVSHGLAISELVAARKSISVDPFSSNALLVLRRSPPGAKPPAHAHPAKSFKGLPNTGWTQVCINIQPMVSPSTRNATEGGEEDAVVQMEIQSIYTQSVNNAPHLVHVVSQVHHSSFLLLTTYMCRKDRLEGLEVPRTMRNNAGYANSLEVVEQAVVPNFSEAQNRRETTLGIRNHINKTFSSSYLLGVDDLIRVHFLAPN